MTTISAVMGRTYFSTMFADLTDVPHTFSRSSGLTTLTFESDLSDEVAHAIWLRMESKSDADQTKRADLRAARDAVIADPTPENMAALAVLNANYTLGD